MTERPSVSAGIVEALAKDFDYKRPDIAPWPYPYFSELIERGHVVCPGTRHGGFHAILGRDATVAAAKDTATFSSNGGVNFPFLDRAQRPAHIPIEIDPPEHASYRRLIQPRFSPGFLKSLEPRIEEVADDLIAKFVGKAGGDLATGLALPLPSVGLALWMGFEPSEGAMLSEWADRRLRAIQAEDTETNRAVLTELRGWLTDAVERREGAAVDADGGDIIDLLRSAVVNGRPLSTEEIVGYIQILVFAGHETTASGIANSIWHLAQHPDRQQWLRDNLELLPEAVEEFLRLDAPVQAMGRTATVDVELDGHCIHAKEPVLLFWGAANHDPAAFKDPGEFRLRRAEEEGAHLSFGWGAHRCIGAPLARLEMAIALSKVLTLLPPFSLDPEREVEHEWGTTHHITALPLRFEEL